MNTNSSPAIVIIKLIAVGFLLAALGSHNHAYYLLLRCIICGVAALAADQAADRERDRWVWAFWGLALVFNPVMPPRFGSVWPVMDILAALLLLASIVRFHLTNGKKREPIQTAWIKQKKAIMGWTLLAVALLYLGGFGFWVGSTHVGPGVLQFGGDEPGTGGMAGTEEFEKVVPESAYKEQFYFEAIIFSAFGCYTLWHVRKMWKKRKGEEEYWKGMVQHSGAAERIKKDWPYYRDDFKQWLEENHPNLLSPENLP